MRTIDMVKFTGPSKYWENLRTSHKIIRANSITSWDYGHLSRVPRRPLQVISATRTRQITKMLHFYYAIALTESGRFNEAMLAWDSLEVQGDAAISQLAKQLKNVLQASPSQALNMPDQLKYQYCRYKVTLRDTVLFKKISSTFQNDNYKAQALLDFAIRFHKADQTTRAIQFFDQITGLTLTDKKLYDDVRHFELQMLASRNEVRSLATQINKDISFDDSHQLHKLLYAALVSEASGDTTNAKKNYDILAKSNPYFEEGILAAANFFRNQDPGSLKAYDILVDAIYVNTGSVRLLKAYVGEASRQGFDEYAASAAQRLDEMESNMY
jgi:hypothetical protein